MTSQLFTNYPEIHDLIDDDIEDGSRKQRLALERQQFMIDIGKYLGMGLGKLTSADLTELRALILTVIDDGDPKRSANVGCTVEWDFYGSPEWDADDQRQRFCDVICAEIKRRATSKK